MCWIRTPTSNLPGDYTLSVINLSEMEKADAVVEEIARQIDYNLSYVGKALSEGKNWCQREAAVEQTYLISA